MIDGESYLGRVMVRPLTKTGDVTLFLWPVFQPGLPGQIHLRCRAGDGQPNFLRDRPGHRRVDTLGDLSSGQPADVGTDNRTGRLKKPSAFWGNFALAAVIFKRMAAKFGLCVNIY